MLRSATLLLAALLALPAANTFAQQRYELTEGEWLAHTPPDPDSNEGKLEAIRKLIAEGRGKKAQELAGDWIEANPNHPLLVEAYLLRGDALVAQKDYWNSLYDYESVIRLYPGSEQYHVALEREYEIARLYVGGTNRHLLGMQILSAKSDGEELLIRCQERAPGSEVGERASITLADYFFDEGDMYQASEAYDLFLLNYPYSDHREWAMLRLIVSNLARFKGEEFDPTGLLEARQRLRDYFQQYPAAAELNEAQGWLFRIDESLALEDYAIARWYERRGERVSAIYLYRRIVEQYPGSGAAQQALDRLKAMDAPLVAKHKPAEEPAPAAPQQEPEVEG